MMLFRRKKSSTPKQEEPAQTIRTWDDPRDFEEFAIISHPSSSSMTSADLLQAPFEDETRRHQVIDSKSTGGGKEARSNASKRSSTSSLALIPEDEDEDRDEEQEDGEDYYDSDNNDDKNDDDDAETTLTNSSSTVYANSLGALQKKRATTTATTTTAAATTIRKRMKKKKRRNARALTLTTMPPEIILLVAAHLPYPDLLALRHTHPVFLHTRLLSTQKSAKIAWLLERASQALPLPRQTKLRLDSDAAFCSNAEVRAIIAARRRHGECDVGPAGCTVVRGATCGGCRCLWRGRVLGVDLARFDGEPWVVLPRRFADAVFASAAAAAGWELVCGLLALAALAVSIYLSLGSALLW